MPLTTTDWIAKLAAYPPDTLVRFIGNTIVFEDPATGTTAQPTAQVAS